METFTPEETELLKPFVSNMDKSIFALTNLPEVVKGALFSRYSRSAKSLRRVLIEEFLSKEAGLGLHRLAETHTIGNQSPDSVVQTRKAEEFYERVLVGYGDDSVAELAGAHIAVEDISILATKTLQDSRIGLSPLEKSTRYVYFDNRQEDGTWRYLKETTLMAPDSDFVDLYKRTCDHCFQTYADLIPKVSQFVIEAQPKDDQTTDRAYKSTVRAKTCDILRGLLPASTLTNMGFFGDGRAFEYILTKLYSDDLVEMHDIATTMHSELGKVIPSFVKRANDKYGMAMQDYFRRARYDLGTIAARLEGQNAREETHGDEHDQPKDETVDLVHYDKDGENRIIIAALYPYLNRPMTEVESIVSKMSDAERLEVIKASINRRDNRRQKPGREFEHCSFTFDILGNYGAYRDLHRHRILTQQRQELTPHLGYKLPVELIESGYESQFKDVMEVSRNAYEEIARKNDGRYRKEAQYVVALAYNIRWYMKISMREAYHMLELRSSMQGHIDYRKIAQMMFRGIEKVQPNLAAGMKFMDMKEYAFERLEAEKRIDKKLEEIAKRYGNGDNVRT